MKRLRRWVRWLRVLLPPSRAYREANARQAGYSDGYAKGWERGQAALLAEMKRSGVL